MCFIYVHMCMLDTQSCLTLQPHGLEPVSLLCSWDFPGKNTGGGCHFLLQGIFLTQGLSLGLLCLPQFYMRSQNEMHQINICFLLLLMKNSAHGQFLKRIHLCV